MASNPNNPSSESGDDILPTWDVPLAVPVTQPVSGEIPLALPVHAPLTATPPLAIPVTQMPPETLPPETQLAVPTPAEGVSPAQELSPGTLPVPVASSAPNPFEPVLAEPIPSLPATLPCPACGVENPAEADWCSDCGYYFSPSDRDQMRQQALGQPVVAAKVAEPAVLLKVQGRYELRQRLSSRGALERWKGLDLETQQEVIVLRQPLERPTASATAVPVTPEPLSEEDEILPSFDEPEEIAEGTPATQVLSSLPVWPSVGWERQLLLTLE
ncbi:MAG: hypothetical protein SNJ75_04680, partial [Gemmataceae bacterium]